LLRKGGTPDLRCMFASLLMDVRYRKTTNMPIKIFTTGGTIDKTYFDQKSTYQVGEPQASGLLERANVVVDYDVTSIMQNEWPHIRSGNFREECRAQPI